MSISVLIMLSTNIKIANWNVRVLNCPARREIFLKLVNAARPNIVCIQETKLDYIDSLLALQVLGPQLSEFDYIPAMGTCGGVLIAWDPDQIEAHDSTALNFCLSMWLKEKGTEADFYLTNVYGPANDTDKPSFLDELRIAKPAPGTPWICLGDFNLIYEVKDKNNANLNRRLMGQFRNALDDCQLMEIALPNRRYTWSNERERPTLGPLRSCFLHNSVGRAPPKIYIAGPFVFDVRSLSSFPYPVP